MAWFSSKKVQTPREHSSSCRCSTCYPDTQRQADHEARQQRKAEAIEFGKNLAEITYNAYLTETL